MTIATLTLICSFIAMIGSLITISAFIGYIARKRRLSVKKDKLNELNARIKELEIKIMDCEKIIECSDDVEKRIEAKYELKELVKEKENLTAKK